MHGEGTAVRLAARVVWVAWVCAPNSLTRFTALRGLSLTREGFVASLIYAVSAAPTVAGCRPGNASIAVAAAAIAAKKQADKKT